MARKRNKKTIISGVRLDNYAAEGKSVAKMEDGKTLFVKGGVPGDVVSVRIEKNKTAFAEGQVVQIEIPSPDRIEPFCEHFGTCGGCKWQMLPYHLQAQYKHQQVVDQLSRLAKIKLPEIEPIIAHDTDRLYRNKMEFTFSELPFIPQEIIDEAAGADIPQAPAVGLHAAGFFDKVVDIHTCHLMAEPMNAIRNRLKAIALEKGLTFYNARQQQGWLRNVVIRISTLGEVMVNLVVKEEQPVLFEILDVLKEEFPNITSLNYTINPKVNDALYDLTVVCYHGKEYIEEKLEHFIFKISPKSFFQTNSRQTEKLYGLVREWAGLTGKEIVYDLYCGTGSIGIFLSEKAGKIIGIETVADAIEDAKLNADRNKLENASFFVGDVIKIVNADFFATHGRPDVIITDPPRAGMLEKMLEQLLQIAAPRIVYVSCNPATQARDLQVLDEKYEVLRVRPVDMFPQTHHVENVVLLGLRQEL